MAVLVGSFEALPWDDQTVGIERFRYAFHRLTSAFADTAGDLEEAASILEAEASRLRARARIRQEEQDRARAEGRTILRRPDEMELGSWLDISEAELNRLRAELGSSTRRPGKGE